MIEYDRHIIMFAQST